MFIRKLGTVQLMFLISYSMFLIFFYTINPELGILNSVRNMKSLFSSYYRGHVLFFLPNPGFRPGLLIFHPFRVKPTFKYLPDHSFKSKTLFIASVAEPVEA